MGIPLAGNYATYMDSFFGDLTAAEQDELWQRFLQVHGFTLSNPPTTGDVDEEQKFLDFTKNVLQTQRWDLLSPDEVKKRDIMMKTFDILLEMLLTLQSTISVQGNNLIFYGKWQEAYTKILTRVPLYVGGTTSTPNLQKVATVDNLDTFTFGYNKISVDDIANYWARRQTDGIQEEFTIDSPDNAGVPGLPTNKAVQFTVRSFFSPAIIISARDYDDATPTIIPISTQLDVSSAADPAVRFTENVQIFKEAFVKLWNEQLSPTDPRTTYDLIYSGQTDPLNPNVPNRLPQIGWRHTAINDDAAKLRAEYNARNQQFIENLRSLRQIVQNQAKQVESNLSQTKEALSQQANLLTSIIEALKSLIAAIFR